MCEFQIELTDAREHREEFVRIFQLYCQELLSEDPTIAQYDPEELANKSLRCTLYEPYLIMAAGEAAGIVVFIDEEEIEGDNDCHTYIGEIFVMPQYRKHGIARKIVTDYISSLKYDTGLCYIRGSYAEKYWNELMVSNGYKFKIFKEDEIRDFIHIYIFEKDKH